MELRQLEYFLVCAQRGSLTRAAEELYTTQPHVSQVIKALERELGTELFRRTGSGIRLTDDGERILFYAQNAVKNASLISETCDDRRGESLRIAANASSRLAFLTEEFFCEEEPALSLQYTECGIEAMMELLRDRSYDMGFLFLPANKLSAFDHMARRRHLVYTPLLTSDLVIHCGRLSPFYGRSLVQPEELDGCACIQIEDEFFSVEELLREHDAFHSGRLAVRKVIHTNSDHLMLGVLRRTALCNIGSYWLRRRDAEDDFSMAVIEGFQQKVSFGYLKSDNRPLSPGAERFLERLRSSLAAEA